MKPRFNTLKHNRMLVERLPADELNAELGRPTGAASTPDAAIRMSLALIKSGLSFNGRTSITAGPNAGRSVESRARRLADQLARPALLGQPESIAPAKALAQLAGKHGVVFFSKPQAQGGYIDLLEPASAGRICHAASQFATHEIRFWPLV